MVKYEAAILRLTQDVTVISGLDVMESPDDIEDYDGTLVVKNERKERRAPSPVDMNRLPPIQVEIY